MSCFELNSYCFTKKKKKKKVMHKFLDVWMCKYGITTESNSAKKHVSELPFRIQKQGVSILKIIRSFI